ncbi:MAG: Asp23/Gls24 family envelope stress response protein [Chlamydiota bacterium]
MQKKHDTLQKMDVRELNFPETKFIRDIDSRVFQEIVAQCLSKIKGIALLEGTLIENLLGRDPLDKIKGIYVEQDLQKHSLYIRLEINICYGIIIPEKAEEIQTKLVEEISALTGLHVSCVHVIFKNLVTPVGEDWKSSSKGEEEFSSRF